MNRAHARRKRQSRRARVVGSKAWKRQQLPTMDVITEALVRFGDYVGEATKRYIQLHAEMAGGEP